MPTLGPIVPVKPKAKLGPSVSRGPSTVPQRDLAPTVTSTPAAAPTVAFDYSGGSGVGGGIAPALTEADYLAGDAAYQATLAAMDAALKQYEADIESQKKKYDVDYEQALGTMGRIRPVGKEGEAGYKPGEWNLTDQNTASGKAYQSQLGDFASRGILQSSLYDRARSDLMRSLDKQLTGVETARTNFMDDLARQLASYKTEDTQKRQQARTESIAGMAGSL